MKKNIRRRHNIDKEVWKEINEWHLGDKGRESISQQIVMEVVQVWMGVERCENEYDAGKVTGFWKDLKKCVVDAI